MIEGVVVKKLISHNDERGFFREIVRLSESVLGSIKQISISRTKSGVIKAFHSHKKQDDLFYLIRGKVIVVLYDARESSSTRGKTEVIPLGENLEPASVFIPKGVLHGYKVIGNDDAEMLYIMNNEYDEKNPDEIRVPHDDPHIGFNWEEDSIEKEEFFELKKCRVCGNEELQEYLDLGQMPLVNSFVSEEEIKNEKFFPLKILFCPNCSLSQLSIVVNPEILFGNYPYRSSMSKHFIKHCSDLAKEINDSGTLKSGDIVMDIASNDGALLQQFKKMGNRVLGIEPAKNIAKIANDEGIETLNAFWTPELSNEVKNKYGKIKVITAFNVLAHAHDLHSFIEGIKNLLDAEGYFIVESPHLQELLIHNQLDTVYHEHLSYLLIKPVKFLVEKHGLKISKITKNKIHGGSIRFYIQHSESKNSDGSVERLYNIEKEQGLHEFESYKNFGKRVDKIKSDLVNKISELKKEGKTVAGYGASAKGNILLNYAKINSELIDYIFDNTPEKQNKLTPGMNIKVVNENELSERNPDYVLLLAWNFLNEIMEKSSEYLEKGGKFIVPIPEVEVYPK